LVSAQDDECLSVKVEIVLDGSRFQEALALLHFDLSWRHLEGENLSGSWLVLRLRTRKDEEVVSPITGEEVETCDAEEACAGRSEGVMLDRDGSFPLVLNRFILVNLECVCRLAVCWGSQNYRLTRDEGSKIS